MRSVLFVERAVAVLVVACAVSVAGAEVKPPGAENTLSLAGTWQFRLDAEGKGVAEKWFTRTLEETVRLPGTTDENQKGTKKDERCEDRLSRVYFWKGPAWYRREVLIPDAWKGKRLTLLDKPEARQLYHSLLRYAASDAFAPATELDIDLLNKMLSTSSAFPREARQRPDRLELTHLQRQRLACLREREASSSCRVAIGT
jgi:hypothetical protein